jgi:hypothetical protein
MSKLKEMNMNLAPAVPYTTEWLKVSDLEIDPEAQRDHLDSKKVEHIKAHWSDAAVGIIVVSRRNPVTHIVLDGHHRFRALAERTDGTGLIRADVYEGLTPAQESQMFIDLNHGNKPDALDTFRHEIRAQLKESVEVDQLTKAFGWTVSRLPGAGTIQAVGAVKRIYVRSVSREREPNTLLLTMKVITGAWGHDRDGAAAVMLEGISAFVDYNFERLDWDSLIHKLKGYAGGPYALHQNATQLAGHKRTKVSMAVAEIMTDLYNKSRTRNALPAWTRRSA